MTLPFIVIVRDGVDGGLELEWEREDATFLIHFFV